MNPAAGPVHNATGTSEPLGRPADVAGAIGPALAVAFRVMAQWELTADQGARLLGCGRSTWYRWRERPVDADLSADQTERLSYLLGIYKALQVLYPTPENADAWVRRPNSNPLFAGRPPLERMLGGQVADLFVVRAYLDALRG